MFTSQRACLLLLTFWASLALASTSGIDKDHYVKESRDKLGEISKSIKLVEERQIKQSDRIDSNLADELALMKKLERRLERNVAAASKSDGTEFESLRQKIDSDLKAAETEVSHALR